MARLACSIADRGHLRMEMQQVVAFRIARDDPKPAEPVAQRESGARTTLRLFHPHARSVGGSVAHGRDVRMGTEKARHPAA
jgi:hypothetical protein